MRTARPRPGTATRRQTHARLPQGRHRALRVAAPRSAVEPCPPRICSAKRCRTLFGERNKTFTETPTASCPAAPPSPAQEPKVGIWAPPCTNVMWTAVSSVRALVPVEARVALPKEATLDGQSPQSNPKAAHHRTCLAALNHRAGRGIRLPPQGPVDALDITHALGFHPGSRDPNRCRGQALAWQGDVTQRPSSMLVVVVSLFRSTLTRVTWRHSWRPTRRHQEGTDYCKLGPIPPPSLHTGPMRAHGVGWAVAVRHRSRELLSSGSHASQVLLQTLHLASFSWCRTWVGRPPLPRSSALPTLFCSKCFCTYF